MVASLSLCKLLYEWMAGAVRVSVCVCTYGCIREIFESRNLRGVPDVPRVELTVPVDDGAAATANVHIKNTEL